MGHTYSRYLAALCSGLLVAPVAAQSSSSDTRPISFDLVVSHAAKEAAACLAQNLRRAGLYPVSYENPGAVVIEGEAVSTIGTRGKALIVAGIAQSADKQNISFRYRHPLSRRYVEMIARGAATSCLPGAVEVPSGDGAK